MELVQSPPRPKRDVVFIAEFRELYRHLSPEGRSCLERLMAFMKQHPEFVDNPAARGVQAFVQSGDVRGLEAYLRRSTIRVVPPDGPHTT
jgi:hypothetical protein